MTSPRFWSITNKGWPHRPEVAGRTMEYFAYGLAVVFALMFVLGLAMHGQRWLPAWQGTSVIIGVFIGTGLALRIRRSIQQRKLHEWRRQVARSQAEQSST